jgi:hypothetical protein
VDLVAGYVNLRILRTQGSTNHQTQFVAEFQLFTIVRHRAIEISPKNNYQKLSMKEAKTNKLWSLLTPKIRPADREILRDGDLSRTSRLPERTEHYQTV